MVRAVEAAGGDRVVSAPAVPQDRAGWRAWVRSVRPGEVRRRAGVLQRDLAGVIGVDPSTLGGWERGGGCPSDDRGAVWFGEVSRLAGEGARGTAGGADGMNGLGRKEEGR